MSTATGTIYDLDYIQGLNWCQVLLCDALHPPGILVGYVRDVHLLTPLRAAMQRGLPVLVSYDNSEPHPITRVVLGSVSSSVHPLPSSGLHKVMQVDIVEREGKYKAILLGEDGVEFNAFTRDIRLADLLICAFVESWSLSYVTIDNASSEITRAKLNTDDQSKAPTNQSVGQQANPTAQLIIDHCFADWDANKSDCNAFVKAVYGDLDVDLPPGADANGIVNFLTASSDWTQLAKGDGQQAKDHADAGRFVIGGMKGSELNPPQAHGHVLIVMSGPLDPTHNQYPRASWGKLNSVGKKDSFVNYAFNSTDRDSVRYFSRQISTKTDRLALDRVIGSVASDAAARERDFYASEERSVGPVGRRIRRGTSEFESLSTNRNPEIVFSNDDARQMTQKLKNALNALAQLVRIEWQADYKAPPTLLYVLNTWDDLDLPTFGRHRDS